MTFTENGKLLPSLFSRAYRRVKLFVFAMNSRRRYSIFVCFVYGLDENNSESEVIFTVCRLPLTSCLNSRIFLPKTWNIFGSSVKDQGHLHNLR